MVRLRIPFIARDEPAAEPEAQTAEPIEVRFFAAINAERTSRGMTPYWWNQRAADVAQARCDDMVARDYFGHVNPDGVMGYVAGLQAAGIVGWTWAGENLAMNNTAQPESVDLAVRTQMGSATHRANILDPQFDTAGTAWAEGPAAGLYRYCTIFLAGAVP